MVSLTNFRSVNELNTDFYTSTNDLVDGNQQRSNKHGRYSPDSFNASNSKLHVSDDRTKAGQNSHFEIRWNNLTYQVEPKWYHKKLQVFSSSASSSSLSDKHDLSSSTGKKNILNNLNGSVKSGQVTAILGPSGAGKTSLLGCLTGKNKSGVSGSVQVISERREPMSICTIPQKDYLLNQLTVRENLWFASRLKHPEENFDHDSNIDRVLELLKLETCIDTKISKISGGQYKRVSIAQELLSNPDILILDEPTSGLDSLTCYKTVMVLRELARLSLNPMAIIVTIHQPQREVFDLFNHIYILAVGGRCIYEGHPSMSIKTINECSGGLHFDANQYNPASYLVEIASSEFGEKPIECLVEHQRRDFHQRSVAQDNALNGSQPISTPGLKKRPSPMVARFKSTLSNLTGSNGASQRLSPKLDHSSFIQPQPVFAYTNAAYDTSQIKENQQLDASELAKENNNKCPQLPVISINGLTTAPEAATAAATLKPSQTSLSLSSMNEPLDEGGFYLDDRLQTHKHNHDGHFFRHCQLLTKRSWLCLCKDPMLTTLRFSAHIIVPLLITLVYGSRVGKPNACPLYESDMDLIDYARRGAKRLLNLQDELRCTFENVGLYFLSIYAFTFSTMCLTSLSFPLNMHVLLKEVRNGWYSIPTYFIGKTLADFPLEFILPTVTLMITYPLTGQPSSYLEWRFFVATGIFVVTSLIAQTQGLIFGALFMNAMQAAVFVAPVSTTPLILLSGFLIRISQMPIYLQQLSNLSYFRYAIESLTIIRYGFGQCPCDPAVVNGKPVSSSGVPEQLKTMTNYWLSTFNGADSAGGATELDLTTLVPSGLNETATSLLEGINETTTATSGVASATMVSEMLTGLEPAALATTEQPVDFFQDITVLLARANSFGADIRTCDDLKPYPMIDFSLQDSQLYTWIAALLATLVLSKVANYLVVKYSVKLRL